MPMKDDMDKLEKIFVVGHKGMVGSAIVRKLQEQGYRDIIVKSHAECDLTKPSNVDKVFSYELPQCVFLAAAKVGGIHANDNYPADFIYQNLAIQTNVIDACYRYKVKKLLFLGSSCIYPRNCKQPIKEDYLLTGALESTNQWYAVAKIAGIKMCQAYNKQYGTSFVPVMPTNLYGEKDNYSLENSHVLPAMIRKFHEAKIEKKDNVMLWGTGRVFREFLHVDDLAEACIFLMNNYSDSEIINIGTGKDITIYALSQIIKKIVGYKGVLAWDVLRPEGTPRKLLDVSKIKGLGWKYKIELEHGIEKTYKNFLKELKEGNIKL